MKRFAIIKKQEDKFIAIDLFHELRVVSYDSFGSCLDLCRLRVGKVIDTEKLIKIPFINIWLVL
jgi:hypothetical protein